MAKHVATAFSHTRVLLKPIAFLTESISSSRSQASVHLSLIRLFIILPLKLSRSKEYSITTAAGVRLPPINGGVGGTLLTEIIVEGSMSSPDGSSTRFIVFVLCVVIPCLLVGLGFGVVVRLA